MVQVKDIEAINARTLAEIQSGHGRSGNFYGFLDIDFLKAPPLVMLHAGDCGVCDIVLSKRTFEPASLDIWCHISRTATGILDIGAYTGIYALAAAAVRPDLTVHAFEPNPYSMARLRTNRFINGLHNIKEHACGVGAQNARAHLSWNKKHLPYLNSAATFANIPATDTARFESASVEIRRIDEPEFCASLGGKILMKIDVEGAEVMVMKGLSALLPRRPDIILESFSREACDTINGLIAPYGYRTYFIDETHRHLRRQEKLAPTDPAGIGMNQFLTTNTELPLPEGP
jgi:FkbM family methyltransferase